MTESDFETFFQAIRSTPLAAWSDHLRTAIVQALTERRHGDMAEWQAVLKSLPDILPEKYTLDQPVVTVESLGLCEQDRDRLREQLLRLHPWRKGPFSLHGVYIDTEWRSDWKWARLESHISPLNGRRVLDVGCGNGYYGWRMLGAGADLVVGIDPTQLYAMQHMVVRHFVGALPVFVLPIGLEDLPEDAAAFDSVFSMGVLYHRRSPIDHLLTLKSLLRPGGELVLETLVIDGDETAVLLPKGRYARMRNVWFLPSPDALSGWLGRCGFDNIRQVDIGITTVKEQRSTEWMRFQSLADFLDPQDSTKTLEGLPAPMRSIIVANNPMG